MGKKGYHVYVESSVWETAKIKIHEPLSSFIQRQLEIACNLKNEKEVIEEKIKNKESELDALKNYLKMIEGHKSEKRNYERKVQKSWRNSVLDRDNYKCQVCGLDKDLEVHHIYSYKDYPELRKDVDNGITLCKWCHHKYHGLYGKSCSPDTLEIFIKKFSVKDKGDVL